RHFPRLTSDAGTRLPRPSYPLVRNVVQGKAVGLKEIVVVDMIDKRDGSLITKERLPIAGYLPLRLEQTGWWAAMRAKEELAVLYRTAASWYRIHGGEMTVTALAPFSFDVVPWSGAPSDPARARQILIPWAGMDYIEDPSKELRFVYERVPGTPPMYFASIVDPDGVPVADLPEGPGGYLLPQVFPVVVWKETESPHPYAPPPLSLYYAQVDLLLEMANAKYGVRIGGHSTLAVGKQTPNAPDWQRLGGGNPLDDGDPADPSGTGQVRQIDIPGSVHDVLQLPDEWKAQQFQRRVDPMAYASWIQMHLKLAYLAEDLVPTQVELLGKSDYNISGKAKQVDQGPRILTKSRREARLKEQLGRDLDTWAAYWNMLAPTSEQIPTEYVGFRVRLRELWSPGMMDDPSTVLAIEKAAEIGLVDLVKLKASIDGTTLDEANTGFWTSVGTYKGAKKPLPDKVGGAAA
ncbi:hypothetical protein HN937_08725, partial [Candidatus Poribacteria bacterium]|nr:hypothetical protein [Candidatus Poribacteria bacterium]